MPIKTQIEALLQEKMDRKDFLKYAGTVMFGILGVTGLIRMILGSRLPDTSSKGDSPQRSSGYGSSPYGK